MGRTLALQAVLLVALAATGGLFVYLLADRPGTDAAGDLDAMWPAPDPELEAATLTGRAEAETLASAPLERLLADLRQLEGDPYRATVRELRERARSDEALLQRLIEGLRGPEWRGYLQALKGLGAQAALPLARFAFESTRWRRSTALDALEQMGLQAAPAVDVIVDRLPEESDAGHRRQMFAILAAVGPAARAAVPLLVGYLTPPLDDSVVREAATTLVAIDAANPATLVALRIALLDEDTRARPVVLGALSRLGPAAAPLVPTVIDLLEDPEESTRYAAAACLGGIGAQDRAVIPGLVSMLEHDHQHGQRAAARALVALGPPGVEALAEVAAKVEDIDVRLNAAQVLLQAEGHSEACVRVLLSVLSEECDKGWKNRALIFLARLDPPPAPEMVLPAIVRALEDPTLAENACRALANVPGEEARTALRSRLGRADEPEVGVSALHALLRSMAEDPGRDPLVASLLREETPTPLVRTALQRAARLSPKASSSVLLPALEPWLTHEDASLRALAHQVLGHLEGDDDVRVERLLIGLADPPIVATCASALRLLPAHAHRTVPALVETLLALPVDSPFEFNVSWAAIALARSWPKARAWVTERQATADETGTKRLQDLLRRIR